MKIRNLLIWLLIVLAATSLLVTGFSILYGAKTIRDGSLASAQGLVDLTHQYVGEYGQEVVAMGNALRGNKLAQQFLMEEDDRNLLEITGNLEEAMHSMLNMKDGVVDIGLYGGRRTKSYYSFCGSYFHHPLDSADAPTFTALYRDNGRGHWYDACYCVMPVYDTAVHYSLKKVGYVVIAMRPRSFNAIFSRFAPSENAIFYMTDGAGNILASGGCGEAEIGRVMAAPHSDGERLRLDGKEYVYLERPVAEMGYEIVYLLPVTDLTKDIRNVVIINLIIFTATMAVYLALSVGTYRTIVQPISRIAAFAAGIGRGKTGERLSLEVHNELAPIVGSINSMLEENEQTTAELLKAQGDLYEAELAHNKARLDYLQSQINPHFLYNTLESIRSIADVAGIPEISTIALAMSRCFRYSISSGEIAPLGRELACVSDYFQVISVRFQGRFTLHIQCPEALQALPVLKMLLQPIVENAVKHGLERRRGPGQVRIRCARKGEHLHLRVENDGLGMTPEALANLRASLAEGANVKSVGLPNTLRRLQSFYGPACAFTVESGVEWGTAIEIRLPIQGGSDV